VLLLRLLEVDNVLDVDCVDSVLGLLLDRLELDSDEEVESVLLLKVDELNDETLVALIELSVIDERLENVELTELCVDELGLVNVDPVELESELIVDGVLLLNVLDVDSVDGLELDSVLSVEPVDTLSVLDVDSVEVDSELTVLEVLNVELLSVELLIVLEVDSVLAVDNVLDVLGVDRVDDDSVLDESVETLLDVDSSAPGICAGSIGSTIPAAIQSGSGVAMISQSATLGPAPSIKTAFIGIG